MGIWRTGRKPVYSDCSVSLIFAFISYIPGVFQNVAQFIVDVYQLLYQTFLYILKALCKSNTECVVQSSTHLQYTNTLYMMWHLLYTVA